MFLQFIHSLKPSYRGITNEQDINLNSVNIFSYLRQLVHLLYPGGVTPGPKSIMENGVANLAFEPDTKGNGMTQEQPDAAAAGAQEASAAARSRDCLQGDGVDSSPDLAHDTTTGKKQLIKRFTETHFELQKTKEKEKTRM